MTPDNEVAQTADSDGRVVVTKDRDFRDSHLLTGSPARLLVVATGNISNNELLELFDAHIGDIATALAGSDYVELHRDRFIARRKT